MWAIIIADLKAVLAKIEGEISTAWSFLMAFLKEAITEEEAALFFPRGSGAAGASALPAHVPGAATAPLSSRAIAGDDVALEALLRQAAVMTAGAGADKASLLHAVTGWFDRWDSGMGELRGGEVIPLQGLTVPSHFFMGRTSLDGDVPDPY